MSKTTKVMFCILLILYFVGIAESQETWDYNKAESYKNQDFLRYSDPSKWDAKRVDWSNPIIFENPSIYFRKDIYNNPQVYNNPTFYKNLPDNAYLLLDYRQVDYDKIVDHSKIVGTKYLTDLGCKLCLLEKIGKSECDSSGKCKEINDLPKDTIKYSKNGIKHIGGDYVSIPGTYGKNFVIFEIRQEGIIISSYSKEKLEIPQTDSVTVSTYSKRTLVYGKDEFDIKDGKITFRNGEVLVKKEDSVRVNGVRVTPTNKEVKLFFDGNEHVDCGCAYVSMNKDKKVLITGTNEKSGHRVSFYSDNPIFKINGPLSIHQDFGTIIVQNRENSGLIPSITMKFNPNEKIGSLNNIYNGGTAIDIHEDATIKHAIRLGHEEIKSNPLVLNIEKMNGESLLGSKNEPKRLIIDENNRISTLSYKEISNREPLRLYFRISEDVKFETEKSREASKRRNELVEETRKRWSVPGMWVFGWLDDSREERIIKALRSTSEYSDVPPEILTALAFNEGLNEYIEGKHYFNRNSEVSGYGHIGLDFFGQEANMLKKLGYLRKDFQEGSEYWKTNVVQEGGKPAVSSDFKNVEVGLEALAARWKWTRDLVLRDAANFGYKLDNDQLDYWTYVYYNCGPRCQDKNQRLENGPQISKKPGTIGAGQSRGNAQRFLGTRDLVKNVGLFEKSSSEQIALK